MAEADHLVSLRSLIALDDVVFDFIAFFQRFVSIMLDGGVVDKDIRAAIATEEAKALGVVEPFNRSMELSHREPPFGKLEVI